MRVLIAEDESKVADQLAAGLRNEGYAVDIAPDATAALKLANDHPYDLLLLDVVLPGRDGFTLLRQLRRKDFNAPVIFVTARGDVSDRVKGLDAGADDYLVKPFSFAELVARVRAVTRRQRANGPHVIRIADLELDLMARVARRGNEEVGLTNREFALLEFLMTNSPRAVSKTAIVEHVWDQHFDPETNVVNVYMNYLRRKIDRPGLKPLLQTVRGVGFALRQEPE